MAVGCGRDVYLWPRPLWVWGLGDGARCIGVSEVGVVGLRGRGLRLGVAKGCGHGLAHVPGSMALRVWPMGVTCGVGRGLVMMGVVQDDVGVVMS